MKRIVLCGGFLLAAASVIAAQGGSGTSGSGRRGGVSPSQRATPTASPTTAKPTPTPAAPPAAPRTHLKVGDKAPDFTLPSTIVADGKTVRYKLSDFKDKKNVVLAFYIFAFTGG